MKDVSRTIDTTKTTFKDFVNTRFFDHKHAKICFGKWIFETTHPNKRVKKIFYHVNFYVLNVDFNVNEKILGVTRRLFRNP